MGEVSSARGPQKISSAVNQLRRCLAFMMLAKQRQDTKREVDFVEGILCWGGSFLICCTYELESRVKRNKDQEHSAVICYCQILLLPMTYSKRSKFLSSRKGTSDGQTSSQADAVGTKRYFETPMQLTTESVRQNLAVKEQIVQENLMIGNFVLVF